MHAPRREGAINCAVIFFPLVWERVPHDFKGPPFRGVGHRNKHKNKHTKPTTTSRIQRSALAKLATRLPGLASLTVRASQSLSRSYPSASALTSPLGIVLS